MTIILNRYLEWLVKSAIAEVVCGEHEKAVKTLTEIHESLLKCKKIEEAEKIKDMYLLNEGGDS